MTAKFFDAFGFEAFDADLRSGTKTSDQADLVKESVTRLRAAASIVEDVAFDLAEVQPAATTSMLIHLANALDTKIPEMIRHHSASEVSQD